MTLALSGIPSLLLQPQRFSYGGRRPACVAHCPRKCRKLCIHCSSGAQGAESVSNAESQAPEAWDQPNGSPPDDSYAGWSFLDVSSKKHSKFSGFLKVGAGIAVAVGFALVSHAASRKGLSNVVPPAPTVKQAFASIQETLTPSKANIDEVEQKQDVDESDLLEVEAEDEKAAAETNPSSVEPDSSTGQVSSLTDEVGGRSDEDDNSSAYATGAASTFVDPTVEESYHAVEESYRDAVNDDANFQQGESPPSPAADASPDISQQAQEAISHGMPESDQPIDQASDQASDQANDPPPDSDIEHHIRSPPKDESSVEEPVLVVVSQVAAEDYTLLVASVDIEASKGESIVELATQVDLRPEDSSALPQDESSPPKVGASPVEHAADLIAPETDKLDSATTSPSSESEFTCFGIPAPSTPFVLASGRVIVPPVVDNAQEQSVAALQSLKVVEPGVEAADICTRREYARWLISANRTLARSTAAKVLPAMYIDNVSELAFSDVSPSDPDFPFIQGLAEAGLIASKLSLGPGSESEDVFFSPDSPLSRQDLVSWKLALDHHTLRDVDFNKLQERTGFIDLEQVHRDAWPAIAADVASGERSIIASAFGYTRRFQPLKPVTKGQAAMAFVAGDTSEQVIEELARLEAEKLAEKAVAAEIAFEARLQKESNEVFREELELQKQMAAEAEETARSLKAELDGLKAEREGEKLALLKERASVDVAKESVSQTKSELDTMMQEVSLERVRVVFERERLEKLLAEIEEERDVLIKLKSEMEVETKALVLARAWAEEEAKKARAHAKVLEAARKRWETQGIEVHVDKDLDDTNIPVPSWQFNSEKPGLDSSETQHHEQPNVMVKADEYKMKSMQLVKAAMDSSAKKLSSVQQQMASSMRRLRDKAGEVQRSTFFVVTAKAGELQKAASSLAAGLSSLVSENTHRLADGCKGSAEKLAQIFKP